MHILWMTRRGRPQRRRAPTPIPRVIPTASAAMGVSRQKGLGGSLPLPRPPSRNVHFALESAVPTVVFECEVHISAKKRNGRPEQLRRPGEKGSLSVSHRNSPGLSRRGSWREHLRRSAGFESSARLRLGGDSRADGTVDTAAGDRSRPRAAGAPAARTGGPCEGARLVVWWQFPRAPARPAAPRVIHRMCTFRRFRVSFPPVSAREGVGTCARGRPWGNLALVRATARVRMSLLLSRRGGA